MVLSRGWAELDAIDGAPDCILVGEVNHQALFPRTAVVVHHGGAGTTTTAALAGLPQVVSPMFTDQFYWAGRVCSLGLGAVAPGPDLTASALAVALEKALQPSIVKNAAEMATHVSSDGAGIAARRLVSDFG